MAADRRLARDLPRPHRSWGQRLVLALGALVAVTALGAAAVVGWAAWQLREIDRTDVVLDELIEDGPRNYLLVGSDSRADGDPVDPSAVADHNPLADTIIIVRIDPATKDASMLSLPRDLWITHPGTGEEGRINATYAAGHQELVDTIRAELDIPIHHYVEIDFQGFQEVVSAIGGVPMWFDQPLRDRNTGLDIENPGCTTLDGPGALAFARARHLQVYDEEEGRFRSDGTGDLGRISRQQVFVRRVVDRARDEGLHNPLTLKRLVEVGTSNVTLDEGLSVGELVALGERFSSFDPDALRNYTLPVTPFTTNGGAQVVELDRDEAEPILDLFRDPDDPDEVEAAVTGPTLPAGEVELTVLNSSGRQGLAAEVADALAADGFGIARVGNGAELDHPSEAATVVRYAPGTEQEAGTVAAHLDGAVALEEDADLADGQVALFLGDDFPQAGSGTDADATGGTSEGTSTTAATTSTTSTTVPAPSEPVGVVPDGEPPAGQRCG